MVPWFPCRYKDDAMRNTDSTLTRTERNLWNAIVSEAMAHLKYTAYAHKALVEGYPEVAQVFQEVALHHLPVRVCMDRAGYVGGDGAVMHGFMDIAMYKVFPKSVLLAPCDEPTMRAALRFMLDYDQGPSFVRYPRDNVAEKPLNTQVEPFEMGKAALVRPPKGKRPDLAILAYGAQVYEASAALDVTLQVLPLPGRDLSMVRIEQQSVELV